MRFHDLKFKILNYKLGFDDAIDVLTSDITRENKQDLPYRPCKGDIREGLSIPQKGRRDNI